MSAQRRQQLRDHLGRFTSRQRRLGGTPGRRLGPLGPLARRCLAWTLVALRSDLARRGGRLVLVAAALAAAVVVLYQHGDTPAALARPAAASATPAVRVTATASPATARRQPGTAWRPDPAGAIRPDPERGRAPAMAQRPEPGQPERTAGQPAQVAAAWYAARQHLPADQVHALQQDVISQRQVRVLVLADRGHGRLDTALVTVRRDGSGRWSAP
jgi:hypothetical protein